MQKERGYIFDRNNGAEYYLDEYEQDIEDNMHLYLRLDPAQEKKKIAELVEMAKEYNGETEQITLDVPTKYLDKIKYIASRIGLSYHQYINNIIHEDAVTYEYFNDEQFKK